MDEKKRTGRFYLTFFGLVCALFIGLMGYVYSRVSGVRVEMLDEHGKVVTTR